MQPIEVKYNVCVLGLIVLDPNSQHTCKLKAYVSTLHKLKHFSVAFKISETCNRDLRCLSKRTQKPGILTDFGALFPVKMTSHVLLESSLCFNRLFPHFGSETFCTTDTNQSEPSLRSCMQKRAARPLLQVISWLHKCW